MHVSFTYIVFKWLVCSITGFYQLNGDDDDDDDDDGGDDKDDDGESAYETKTHGRCPVS